MSGYILCENLGFAKYVTENDTHYTGYVRDIQITTYQYAYLHLCKEYTQSVKSMHVLLVVNKT